MEEKKERKCEDKYQYRPNKKESYLKQDAKKLNREMSAKIKKGFQSCKRRDNSKRKQHYTTTYRMIVLKRDVSKNVEDDRRGKYPALTTKERRTNHDFKELCGEGNVTGIIKTQRIRWL